MSPVPASRGVPLRRRLLAIALAGILPLTLVALVALYLLAASQERAAEQRNLDVTRLTATAIETELNRSFAVLESLALAPMLDGQKPDLDEYSAHVRRILPLMPHWYSLLVISPEGNLLRRISVQSVNREGSLADPDSFKAALHKAVPSIGNLARGPGGRWGIPIRVPVIRDGELKFMLTAVLLPSAIHQVIDTGRLPDGWYITVLDGNGRRIARSRLHESTVGEQASEALVNLLANSPGPEGFGLSQTVEGAPVYTAFVRLRGGPGWTVASGMPSSMVEQAVTQTFLMWGGGFILSLLAAIGAALVAGRRISGPIGALREAAQAIGNHQVPLLPSSNIVEIREVGEALVAAGRARQDSEQARDDMLVHLTQAEQTLTQQVEDLKQLQSLSSSLLRMPDLNAQLGGILQVLCQLHGTGYGMLLLSEGGGPLMARVVTGFTGLPRISPDEADLALAAQLIGGQRLVITDLHSDARFPNLANLHCLGPFTSAHSTPVRSSDGLAIGALMVLSEVPSQPDPWQIYLSDLCAGLASVYLDRAAIQATSEASQRSLRVALESSSAPFCILIAVRDGSGEIADFRCEFINPRGADMLQRPAQELIGVSALEVLGSWRESRLFQVFAEIVGLDESRELDLANEGGAAPRWIHVIATSFGERVAVWFPDITERKQQEQLIREADRRKDEFLATLAHELRNPLAPIRMAASLFGSPRATEQQKERSQHIIQRQVSHMAMLLDDLFDISRITLGKLTIRPEPLDLRTIAQSALETARPKIASRNHRVSIALPPEPLRILGDAMRLEQVVTNLLTNAAKFTPEGGSIRLSCHRGEGQACLVVQDDGVGITAELLGTIFEKFAQAPAQRGVVTTGLGIGLALARELARLHGGDVTAASAGPGEGASFTLCLPLQEDLPAPVVRVDERSTKGGALKILVADDNRDIAETLATVLRLEGHEVEAVLDGEAAMDIYERMGPDVVLLDIGMPRMRGDEVARAIRKRENGTRVRLIAMTGWGQPSDKEMALEAGFDVHLTKPVDAQTLLQVLRGA